MNDIRHNFLLLAYAVALKISIIEYMTSSLVALKLSKLSLHQIDVNVTIVGKIET